MLVYLTNEPKNKITKDYLKKLVDRMEANSFEVFWTERDGVKKGSAKSELREHQIQIAKAQIFAVVLDGRPLDEKTIFEIGMAYSLAGLEKPKKLICALQLEGVKNIPGEIVNSFDCIAKSEYDFIDCLKAYLKTVSK